MDAVRLFFSSFIFSRFGLMILAALAIIVLPRLWIWFNDGLRKCQ